MSNRTEPTSQPGASWQQVVQALAENGLDDLQKELLNKLAKDLLERKAERDRMQDQLTQLQSELAVARRTNADLNAANGKLLKEKSALELERDQYIKSILALLPKPDVTFTEEELIELEKNGRTLDAVIAEIQRLKGA